MMVEHRINFKPNKIYTEQNYIELDEELHFRSTEESNATCDTEWIARGSTRADDL